MPVTPLTTEELAEALTNLPGWQATDNSLVASFKGPRADLVTFYTALAAAEDAANHHARVTILYSTVTLELNTHDAGNTITARDTTLAAQVNELATAYGFAAA